MAIRSVATTDTLNTFRTTFNSHATDTGDLASLNTSAKGSLVAAINEAFGATSSFTLRDSSSTTQAISGGPFNSFGDRHFIQTQDECGPVAERKRRTSIVQVPQEP